MDNKEEINIVEEARKRREAEKLEQAIENEKIRQDAEENKKSLGSIVITGALWTIILIVFGIIGLFVVICALMLL